MRRLSWRGKKGRASKKSESWGFLDVGLSEDYSQKQTKIGLGDRGKGASQESPKTKTWGGKEGSEREKSTVPKIREKRFSTFWHLLFFLQIVEQESQTKKPSEKKEKRKRGKDKAVANCQQEC